MTGFSSYWAQADGIARAVALLLLIMSVSAWVVILWKGWILARARRSLARALPAFWAANDLESGRAALENFDKEDLLDRKSVV